MKSAPRLGTVAPQTSPRPVSACLLGPIPTLSAHPCRRADPSTESGLLPQSTRTTAVHLSGRSQPGSLPAKRVECSLFLTSGVTRAFATLPLGIPSPHPRDRSEVPPALLALSRLFIYLRASGLPVSCLVPRYPLRPNPASIVQHLEVTHRSRLPGGSQGSQGSCWAKGGGAGKRVVWLL